jgi:hypothetical protein
MRRISRCTRLRLSGRPSARNIATIRRCTAGSYLLRNVKVKAQIEKPLRKEIVE